MKICKCSVGVLVVFNCTKSFSVHTHCTSLRLIHFLSLDEVVENDSTKMTSKLEIGDRLCHFIYVPGEISIICPAGNGIFEGPFSFTMFNYERKQGTCRCVSESLLCRDLLQMYKASMQFEIKVQTEC